MSRMTGEHPALMRSGAAIAQTLAVGRDNPAAATNGATANGGATQQLLEGRVQPTRSAYADVKPLSEAQFRREFGGDARKRRGERKQVLEAPAGDQNGEDTKDDAVLERVNAELQIITQRERGATNDEATSHEVTTYEETSNEETSNEVTSNKETQTRTQSRTQSQTQKLDANANGFVRKILVEIGLKYSNSKFDRKQAFYLASNVKALEVDYGEFPLGLRKLAFDAATSKIKKEKSYELYKTYLASFKQIKTPMREVIHMAALANVTKLGYDNLPDIPELPFACEADRRVLAMHQQMHKLSGGKDYPLSCRVTQEAAGGKLTRLEAIEANAMLETYGLVKCIDRGKHGKGQGKGTAKYRYTGEIF